MLWKKADWKISSHTPCTFSHILTNMTTLIVESGSFPAFCGRATTHLIRYIIRTVVLVWSGQVGVIMVIIRFRWLPNQRVIVSVGRRGRLEHEAERRLVPAPGTCHILEGRAVLSHESGQAVNCLQNSWTQAFARGKMS